MMLPALLFAAALSRMQDPAAPPPEQPAATVDAAAEPVADRRRPRSCSGASASPPPRSNSSQAVDADPNDAAATFYLAYTVYKIAEPKRPFHPEKQQAAELFDKAYELDPNFKPVWAPRK